LPGGVSNRTQARASARNVCHSGEARALDGAQRDDDSVFPLEVLTHHVAIAPMPPEPLGKPLL
jgi:hypothetical protein